MRSVLKTIIKTKVDDRIDKIVESIDPFTLRPENSYEEPFRSTK